jgi:hypothetical protein
LVGDGKKGRGQEEADQARQARQAKRQLPGRDGSFHKGGRSDDDPGDCVTPQILVGAMFEHCLIVGVRACRGLAARSFGFGGGKPSCQGKDGDNVS